jgi:hypothetical protein
MEKLKHLKNSSSLIKESRALQAELDEKVESESQKRLSVYRRINQEIDSKSFETAVSFKDAKEIKKSFNQLLKADDPGFKRSYPSKPGRPKLDESEKAVSKNITIPASIYKEVDLRQKDLDLSRSKVVGELLSDGLTFDALRLKQAKLLTKYSNDVKKLIKKLNIKNRDQYWEGVELNLAGNEKVLAEIFMLSKDVNKFLTLSFCTLSDFKKYIDPKDLSILSFIQNTKNIASIVSSTKEINQ